MLKFASKLNGSETMLWIDAIGFTMSRIAARGWCFIDAGTYLAMYKPIFWSGAANVKSRCIPVVALGEPASIQA